MSLWKPHRLRDEVFSSHRSDSIIAKAIIIVIEIIHWPVPLMVRKFIMTVKIFQDWNSKNNTPMSDTKCSCRGDLWQCYLSQDMRKTFCFMLLSILFFYYFILFLSILLWFSWIVTSHNYNQSWFRVICAIYLLYFNLLSFFFYI